MTQQLFCKSHIFLDDAAFRLQNIQHENPCRHHNFAGGFRELAKTIAVPESRVRFWERRKSIPAAYWGKIAAAGVASLEELLAERVAA